MHIQLLPEERSAMGLRGREKMGKEFDEQIVIDAYLSAVAEVAMTVS